LAYSSLKLKIVSSFRKRRNEFRPYFRMMRKRTIISINFYIDKIASAK